MNSLSVAKHSRTSRLEDKLIRIVKAFLAISCVAGKSLVLLCLMKQGKVPYNLALAF